MARRLNKSFKLKPFNQWMCLGAVPSHTSLEVADLFFAGSVSGEFCCTTEREVENHCKS